ncbi:MAG: NAD(P)H-binding protein [Clostridia bacterium]|nr:NAD(P)H-binding protein [Clostridia bacterium]
MQKKALLIGGTGALGHYLTPALLEMGYKVDVVSLESMISNNPNLRYIEANAKKIDVLKELLKNEYNVIVDFLIYRSPEEFANYYKLYLENTDHYVFLSSYRVYSGETPITELSPRLLDVTTDQTLLNSGDYCIYKAQQEDMLRSSGHKNWTILRPAITYSYRRYQLVTLEADVFVYRMLRGKTVVVPDVALGKFATMSWAGDFGTAVSRLILNPMAMGQVYTVSTSENNTWEKIADIYKKVGGLKLVVTDTENYLNILGAGDIGKQLVKQQLVYDRYFDRIVDNTKLLNATGMKQSDFMPLSKGLPMELAKATIENIKCNIEVNRRMDEFLAKY